MAARSDGASRPLRDRSATVAVQPGVRHRIHEGAGRGGRARSTDYSRNADSHLRLRWYAPGGSFTRHSE